MNAQQSQPKITQDIVDAAKKAFNPSATAESREQGLHEYNELVDRTQTWILIHAFNALIKPNVLPLWLREPLMRSLTSLPLRSDGVRATMEFVFAVHPSNTGRPTNDGGSRGKEGAAITHEAVAVATKLLSSVPASTNAQQWFDGISGQLFALFDGEAGPDVAKTAAQIVGFGILGKKQFGAPGAPGWNAFVQPLVEAINPSLKSSKPNSSFKSEEVDEIVELGRTKILVTASDLERSLSRLELLIMSNPSPGLCKRVLKPVRLQLWALASWMNASQDIDKRFCRPARILVQTHLRLFGDVDNIIPFIRNIRCKGPLHGAEELQWRYHLQPEGGIEAIYLAFGEQKQEAELNWGEIESKSTILVEFTPLGDDILGVVLSLLNLVITAPTFQKSDINPAELMVVEGALARIGDQDRGDASITAKNLALLLKYRDEVEKPDDKAAAPTARQIEDRKTYNLAMNYITGDSDNPPPVVSEGLNLLSNLIVAESPVLDISAVTVLMSNLLKENEDFINLRVIRIFTQLANKHPKSTMQELLDHYLDAQEKSSTDTRLRFGEAILQVIERLGETFTGEAAQNAGESMLSIAGRRGYRPKTMAKQVREERLNELKRKKAETSGDADDDVDMADEEATPDEMAKNEILAQIVQGWESNRGSEDIRMRTSALSIFGNAIETNILGMGPTLVSAGVDLSINILAMEPELEKGILRRAAILVILSFVRALDKAKESGQKLGFGLTDQSREDIQRTLNYIAATDNDGLVQQHARDVVESLENWGMASLLPSQAEANAAPGLARLAGLHVNPEGTLVDAAGRPRPRIEEVE
ncbi:RNA polymerase II assembly factor RTP1 [Trichoderma asperellum]|uniref:RNA polymerase II assembly factor RTP1 n=1 Tax=Trichoderma asperellum TaxID=101201 RepID=A0A6V8QK44_TRIAP|nr:RNA polymerase II assembly factor RTP1 [Trichoderma asperellum]